MARDEFSTNRIRVKVLLLLGIVLSIGCSSSKTVFDVPQELTGEIMVVGNEPFTRLAVRVEGGEIYLIKSDDEIRQSLLSHQGKIAELFYDEIQKNNSGREIKVVKLNYLSK